MVFRMSSMGNCSSFDVHCGGVYVFKARRYRPPAVFLSDKAVHPNAVHVCGSAILGAITELFLCTCFVFIVEGREVPMRGAVVKIRRDDLICMFPTM
jgi:hypothetical protein